VAAHESSGGTDLQAKVDTLEDEVEFLSLKLTEEEHARKAADREAHRSISFECFASGFGVPTHTATMVWQRNLGSRNSRVFRAHILYQNGAPYLKRTDTLGTYTSLPLQTTTIISSLSEYPQLFCKKFPSTTTPSSR